VRASYSARLGTPAHIAFYQAVRTVGPGRAAVFMNVIPLAGGVIAGVALTTRR
jgi:drug/metabolite transporter (DMT)-like permease